MSKYVVLDFEMCNIPRRAKTAGMKQEIIQIGAVLLDETMEPTDLFMTYVNPAYGELDSFICELTGITEENIAGAPDSQTAFAAFADWIPEDAVPVSWSESDRVQLERELFVKSIYNEKLEALSEKWTDCQKIFGFCMGTDKRYRLCDALAMADVEGTEGEHDALSDAYNTALLFAKTRKEDTLQLSSYMFDGDTHSVYTPFADLFAAVGCC